MFANQRIFIAMASLVITLLVFATVLHVEVLGDECLYMDPGANLALGRGFVSSSWDGGAPGLPWGSSTPAFPLFFAGIFKVFGFNVWVARTAVFLIHVIGAILLIKWACRAFRLSAWTALGVYLVCMGAPSISGHALYRPRLECFALIYFAAFLFLTDAWSRRARMAGIWLGIFGAVVIMTGLHFAAFFVLSACVFFLLEPSWHRLRFGLIIIFGLAVGLGLLRIVYGDMGVWGNFVSHRAAHYGRDLPWVPHGIGRFLVTKDLGAFAAVSLTLLIAMIWLKKFPRDNFYLKLLGSVLIIFVSVPTVIGGIGIWWAGYAWMSGIPMLLIAACLISARKGWPACVLACFGLMLALAGFGRELIRLPERMRDGQLRREVIMYLKGSIQPGEAVASSSDFFYDVRAIDTEVFFRVDLISLLGFPRASHLPEAERLKTKWLLTTRLSADSYLEGLGGTWVELKDYHRTAPSGDYLIYRRVEVPAE